MRRSLLREVSCLTQAMEHWATAVKIKEPKKSKQSGKCYLRLTKVELQYVGVFIHILYD